MDATRARRRVSYRPIEGFKALGAVGRAVNSSLELQVVLPRYSNTSVRHVGYWRRRVLRPAVDSEQAYAMSWACFSHRTSVPSMAFWLLAREHRVEPLRRQLLVRLALGG
jgi:hypothetical protein